MPRFHFQLEPLLRARRRAERDRQRVVAELEQERARLEAALRAQQEHIDAGRNQMRERMVGRVLVHELRAHTAASMKQMAQAQRVVLELAGLHRRLEGARADLLSAMQARRAIELVREKRHEEWRRSEARAETAALDELAVQRAPLKEQL